MMAERLEIGLFGIFYSRQMLECVMQNKVLVQVLRGNCYEPERLVLYDARRHIDATIARPWRVSKARFSFSSCHVDDWKETVSLSTRRKRRLVARLARRAEGGGRFKDGEWERGSSVRLRRRCPPMGLEFQTPSSPWSRPLPIGRVVVFVAFPHAGASGLIPVWGAAIAYSDLIIIIVSISGAPPEGEASPALLQAFLPRHFSLCISRVSSPTTSRPPSRTLPPCKWLSVPPQTAKPARQSAAPASPRRRASPTTRPAARRIEWTQMAATRPDQLKRGRRPQRRQHQTRMKSGPKRSAASLFLARASASRGPDASTANVAASNAVRRDQAARAVAA